MKKIKWLILPLILGSYALLYMATSYQKECTGDCEKVNELGMVMRENRHEYFLLASRCTYHVQVDTLCIFVKNIPGMDWNLFADTVCQAATQKGLLQQHIFILASNTNPFDTLARKICP